MCAWLCVWPPGQGQKRGRVGHKNEFEGLSLRVGEKEEVIAVHVRLRTATFFGYARLRTAGCEGDARLCTVDQHPISELFHKKWCWWKLC